MAQDNSKMPGAPVRGDAPEVSTITVGNKQRIETVTDWSLIVKKYRLLVGKEEPITDKSPLHAEGPGSCKDSSQLGSSMSLMGS